MHVSFCGVSVVSTHHDLQKGDEFISKRVNDLRLHREVLLNEKVKYIDSADYRTSVGRFSHVGESFGLQHSVILSHESRAVDRSIVQPPHVLAFHQHRDAVLRI